MGLRRTVLNAESYVGMWRHPRVVQVETSAHKDGGTQTLVATAARYGRHAHKQIT